MAFYRGGNTNYFLEQWDRVLRWKNKCVLISERGLKDDCLTTLDYYFSFFINAYHLRDWITLWLKNNDKCQIIEILNKDFDDKDYLRMLRDVCNGSKHFELDKPSVGKQFATPRAYLGHGKIGYMILIGGEQSTPEELSEKIIIYWKDFLHENGLDVLENNTEGPLIPPF